MEPTTPLSSREWEVANLLRQGKSNKLIASALNISERTVEFHLNNIYNKFQVASRVELILKLGESTVAGSAENSENKPVPMESSWEQSLQGAISKIGKEIKMSTVFNSNVRDQSAPMSFFESIRVCLVKYADFNGQASRPEFWWFTLFIVLVGTALGYANQNLVSIFGVAAALPFLAVGARRLHQTGRSGWWQLFYLVPVAGMFVVGILMAVPAIEGSSDTFPG